MRNRLSDGTSQTRRKRGHEIELRGLTKSAISKCYGCEDRLFCAPCLVRNFNESGGDYLKVAPHFCKAAALNRKLVLEYLAEKR